MQSHTPKTVTRTCETCKLTFEAPQREVNRGNGRFCSLKCSAVRPRKEKKANNTCALCGRSFYRAESKKSGSKSGLLFCCRTHKDAAQRIGGIKAIQPVHYGTGKGHDAYRALAFGNLPHRCRECGYKRIPDVLHVHHKDGNRDNNALSNLEILCPTCHTEHHFLNRDHKGPWKLPDFV